jgi:hypothetical protein
MKKYFFISWLIIYVINSITGYFIHHVILGDTYKTIASSLGADVKSRLWVFILISITGSFFLTLIYSVWRKSGSLMEGVKYGFFIGIWITFSEYLSAYASSGAIPLSLVIKWILFGLLQYILSGFILALVYDYKKVHIHHNFLSHNKLNDRIRIALRSIK